MESVVEEAVVGWAGVCLGVMSVGGEESPAERTAAEVLKVMAASVVRMVEGVVSVAATVLAAVTVVVVVVAAAVV